jgi:hypothetical protein
MECGDSQLKEGIRNLKHENVGMAMVMYDQNTLYCSTHPKVFIIVLQTLQACSD